MMRENVAARSTADTKINTATKNRFPWCPINKVPRLEPLDEKRLDTDSDLASFTPEAE
jgi:hypothetical protein